MSEAETQLNEEGDVHAHTKTVLRGSLECIPHGCLDWEHNWCETCRVAFPGDRDSWCLACVVKDLLGDPEPETP